MYILIVESDEGLSSLWKRYLEREGCAVKAVADHESALNALRHETFDALVLDLNLPDGAVLAISDFATYRDPDIPIIVVTGSNFFSDGSIFSIIPNARSHLQTPVRPGDLAAVVGHYARH